MKRHTFACSAIAALGILAAGSTLADREPVLKQVDLPHSYYWRELYLPQLTTGPSAVSFTPDGEHLVYSMAGSLWEQALGSRTATEMTHAQGAYDYQPDVSRDGRYVVFTRYDGASMELWRLEVATGREEQLTSGGDVNVEPRLSPDGRMLAWVSTKGTGHFNLYVAGVDPGGLHEVHPLLGERRSNIDRYYYSAFDHAVNPSWSADGATIYFVSNAEVAWGSGDIWAVPVKDPSARHVVLHEETTWSARPEAAPSGKRLLYSSYHGRQWHQLWLTTTDGDAPLPLTFGDYDSRNARWSPDGTRIAYISNEHGNTELVVLQVVGGARQQVVAAERRYKAPRETLTVDIVDAAGHRTPARVSVTASDGRAYAPSDAWMHADDGFDRSRQKQETHYFHCRPPCRLEVPTGAVSVTVQHGFAVRPWQGIVRVEPGRAATVRAQLVADPLPPQFGRWVSADLHVHMNYGGHYRNTPAHLVEQAEAEDLNLVYDLIVNKEERVPDIGQFRSGPDPASIASAMVLHAQEFHTSYWGHLGLLDLSDHFLTPDFAAYRHTAMASPYPFNGVVADLAHQQGALVGYVHPYDVPVVPEKDESLTHELPADVIAGKVDYLEIVAFSDHKATADVWYRLLNLGFHLPAGAGTDAMANYASLRGPVGLNRVFLDTGGKIDPQAARKALEEGRSFASNGPLLGLEIGGVKPGGTVKSGAPGARHFRVSMRSPVAVDHLQIVVNGKIARDFELKGDRRVFDGEGDLAIGEDGWLVLRAWNDQADPLVLDIYPYATTSPVYLQGFGPRPDARQDAAFFVTWLDRMIVATRARSDDFNDDRERQVTFDYLEKARAGYAALAAGGKLPDH